MSRGIQHLRGANDKPTNLQACEQSELLEAFGATLQNRYASRTCGRLKETQFVE